MSKRTDKTITNSNNNKTTRNQDLNDSFSCKHVGFDLGEEHEAEVERDIRLGPVHLQLFDRTTQQSFDALIVAFSLRCLDLIQ